MLLVVQLHGKKRGKCCLKRTQILLPIKVKSLSRTSDHRAGSMFGKDVIPQSDRDRCNKSTVQHPELDCRLRCQFRHVDKSGGLRNRHISTIKSVGPVLALNNLGVSFNKTRYSKPSPLDGD